MSIKSEDNLSIQAQKDLETLKGIVEKDERKIKEQAKRLIPPLEILCSSSNINDVIETASRKIRNGYDGPLLIIKGKESNYRWFAKVVEQKAGEDPRGEVYMIFYLKSPEEVLHELKSHHWNKRLF